MNIKRQRVFKNVKPPTVSLRDYFAAAALTNQGFDVVKMLSSIAGGGDGEPEKAMAAAAYKVADAMIEARNA